MSTGGRSGAPSREPAGPPGLSAPGYRRFRASVRRFVESELRPRAAAWERRRALPRRAIAACARRGFLTVDPRRNAVLAEELPRSESPGLALTILVQFALVAPLLDSLATDGQKRRFLAPVLRGRSLGAVAVTEPGAGSDLAALGCHAEERRGVFAVTGIKTYITNAAGAEFLIVAAQTGPAAEMSLLLVPAGTRGVRVERLEPLGLATTGMGRITFRNARVPVANLLGERGAGPSYVQEALNRERLFGGLAAVAWAEHIWRKTAVFARDRRAFGKPLIKFQAIRHQFAEIASSLEAARQLNYATYGRWLAGEDVTREICMIKLFSYQVVQDVVARCLQIHGGAGYLDDHWVSRCYRDARALTIAAGTPEVMKDHIAAYLRL
jgi:acyl-CoA dehydrogenase